MKIRITAILAALLALTACAERGYVVQKIILDESNGRNYLICTHPTTGDSVEYNVTANAAFHTKVGESCLDDWVSKGRVVTPAPSSAATTQAPPTT